MWSREAGGKCARSRGVGREEEKTKNSNVMGRRIGKTPCHPLQCGHLQLSKPPCLLSDPAKSLPSWPWGTRHQPSPLQPELQQRRGASLQPSAHFPLQSTGTECDCRAAWLYVRLCSRLVKVTTFSSAFVSLLAFLGRRTVVLLLHFPLSLLCCSCSCSWAPSRWRSL